MIFFFQAIDLSLQIDDQLHVLLFLRGEPALGDLELVYEPGKVLSFLRLQAEHALEPRPVLINLIILQFQRVYHVVVLRSMLLPPHTLILQLHLQKV